MAAILWGGILIGIGGKFIGISGKNIRWEVNFLAVKLLNREVKY